MTRQIPRSVARTHWWAARYCHFHKRQCMYLGPSAKVRYWYVEFEPEKRPDEECLFDADNDPRYGLELVYDAEHQ